MSQYGDILCSSWKRRYLWSRWNVFDIYDWFVVGEAVPGVAWLFCLLHDKGYNEKISNFVIDNDSLL